MAAHWTGRALALACAGSDWRSRRSHRPESGRARQHWRRGKTRRPANWASWPRRRRPPRRHQNSPTSPAACVKHESGVPFVGRAATSTVFLTPRSSSFLCLSSLAQRAGAFSRPPPPALQPACRPTKNDGRRRQHPTSPPARSTRRRHPPDPGLQDPAHRRRDGPVPGGHAAAGRGRVVREEKRREEGVESLGREVGECAFSGKRLCSLFGPD